MVPHTARRGFSEPHSSVKNFDGSKRGRTHQFYEAVAPEEVFMVGCVSPIAGRSSFDSVSDITAGTVAKYCCVFVDFNFFPVVKVSRYALVMSTNSVRFVALLPITKVTFLDNHDTQREEAQISCRKM